MADGGKRLRDFKNAGQQQHDDFNTAVNASCGMSTLPMGRCHNWG
jgi:hypothetical protein